MSTVVEQLTNRWTLFLSSFIWALLTLCSLAGPTHSHLQAPNNAEPPPIVSAIIAAFFIVIVLKTLEIVLFTIEECTKKIGWLYYVILAIVVS